MFAVYNNGSLRFRDTVDNLYNITKIDAPAPVVNYTHEGLPQSFDVEGKNENQKQQHPDAITQEAKNAYMKMLNADSRTQLFHIKDIMSKEVETINEHQKIKEAYEIMREKNYEQLVVLDDDGRLKGIVNKYYILNALIDEIDFAKTTIHLEISSILNKDVIATDPISDIRRVARVMMDFNLNAIPVVNKNDELVGIVSRSDIVKAVAKEPHIQIWS